MESKTQPPSPAPSKTSSTKSTKKKANPDQITLTRAEKRLIENIIPSLCATAGIKMEAGNKIRLIKVEVFENDLMSLSFKLEDLKIKWDISLRERVYGTKDKKVGLNE